MKTILLGLLVLLTACTPAPATQRFASQNANLIKLHASPAVQSWEADAFTCADKLGFILQDVPDPQQADLILHLGEPESLSTPAYQIGQEDVLVVTNGESPVQNLDLPAVQNMFSHPDTQQVQIWVFAPEEDIQQVFAQQIMRGQPISSFAQLAASPQQMSDHLQQDKNALGLLPRHWMSNPAGKTGSIRDVFNLPGIPVLAIVKSEPQGTLKNLLSCLQK